MSGQKSPDITFSVVITTEHEEESLASLIKAVAAQSQTEPIEMVVTDYSRESRQELVARLAADEGLPVRCIRVAGLAPFAARNVGIRETTGDVVIFTDDDCTPTPGWLASYKLAFADPTTGIAGGSDKAPASVKPFLRALDYVLTSFVGTGGTRGAGGNSPAYYPRMWNMALSRRAIEATGIFDESLPGAQEFDLTLRVRDAGLSAEFLPDCLVQHRRDTNIFGLIRSAFRSSLGRAYLSRIRPGTARPVHALPAAGAGWCVALLAASSVSVTATAVLAATAMAYAVVLTVSGTHATLALRNPLMLPLVPVLMAAQHLSHAAGYASGLVLASLRAPQGSH